MKYIVSFLIVTFCSTLFSQQNQKILSLQDAINEALINNPVINQINAQIQGKKSEWRTVTGLYDPYITYSIDGVSDSKPETYDEQRITLNEEIDFPLTAFYRIKRVQNEKMSLEMKLNAEKRNTIAQVKMHYVEILYAKHLRELRIKEIKLLNELNSAINLKFETGFGNNMDKLNSEIRLAAAENKLNDADILLHEARYNLFSSIGLEPGNQSYEIEFADTLETGEKYIEQEEALEQYEYHPRYKQALFMSNSAMYKIKEKRSEYIPGIKFGYFIQDFGTGYNHHGFEIGLTIPLWGLITQQGEINMAKANSIEIDWIQKEILLDMKKQVEHAWHSYQNSKQTIENYNNRIKGKSDELIKLSAEAYKLGQINLISYYEAQQLYLSNNELYLDALKDYYLRLIELEQFIDKELVY